MILTRKSHNSAGTTFVQGDSAGGLKLIEQTLTDMIAVTSDVLFRSESKGSGFHAIAMNALNHFGDSYCSSK